MKKFSLALSLLVFALTTFIGLPPASASTPVIRIIDVAHTNFAGEFRDNDLVASLAPTGQLGRAVFGAARTTTWVIDASLIDEVLDMADGYEYMGVVDLVGQQVATQWLTQLRLATAGDPIVALPYGNPDAALARQLSSSELKYYSEAAQQKLEEFFGRPIISQNGWGAGKSRLNRDFQGLYQRHRLLLTGFSQAVDAEEIRTLRLQLGRTLNPLLNSRERAYFTYQGRDATAEIIKKLRIVPGRFQLTSKEVKVPLTLVNNFDTPTTVNLTLTPMNSRVQVADIREITIAPDSSIQISVPFTVIASGSTQVLAQFTTLSGRPIGEVSKLDLSLTVIDSRIAWFTTGAAILLFLGAIAQSVRRVKRGRNAK